MEQKPGEETASISEIIQLIWQPSLLEKTFTHGHLTQAVLATNSPMYELYQLASHYKLHTNLCQAAISQPLA